MPCLKLLDSDLTSSISLVVSFVTMMIATTMMNKKKAAKAALFFMIYNSVERKMDYE